MNARQRRKVLRRYRRDMLCLTGQLPNEPIEAQQTAAYNWAFQRRNAHRPWLWSQDYWAKGDLPYTP